MRNLPAALIQKLKNKRQTKAMNNHMGISAQIRRNAIPLTDEQFLERIQVDTHMGDEPITDIDIAVEHKTVFGFNGDVYIAYIQNGTGYLVSTPYHHMMDAHIFNVKKTWLGVSALSVAFDGSYYNSGDKKVFVTDGNVWFFVQIGDRLYGFSDGAERLELEVTATDLSAVRLFKSDMIDYGLAVFYVQDGDIWCVRRCHKEWCDPEMITFGPDKEAVNITATVTWDYRVCLTVKYTDDSTAVLYSEYTGIGKEVNEVTHGTISTEAILLPEIIPTITEVYNVENKINWGYTIRVNFSEVLLGNGAFKVTSNDGKRVYHDEDEHYESSGNYVELHTGNFNNEELPLRVSYTYGSFASTNKFELPLQSIEFTPINLEPTPIPVNTEHTSGCINADAKLTAIQKYIVDCTEHTLGGISTNTTLIDITQHKPVCTEITTGTISAEILLTDITDI